MNEDAVLAKEKSALIEKEAINPTKEGLTMLGVDENDIVYLG